MKKLLSVLVLSAMFLLPMNAKAAEILFKTDCEKSCPSGNGKCTANCWVDVTGNVGSLTEADLKMEYSAGLKITSMKEGNNWVLSSNGDSVKLLATNGGVSDANFRLMTFTIELESAATDCSVVAKPTNAEYKSQGTTITDEQPPKTGAALPIAIVAVGAVAAGGIYLVTRKNKNLYKI